MKEITETMVHKMKFVQTYLAPMLKRLDPSINAVVYTYDHATEDEYVSVARNNGTQNVCVSMDSLAAMAVEVLREVALS